MLLTRQDRKDIRECRDALRKLRIKCYSKAFPPISWSQQCDLDASRTLYSLVCRRNPNKLYAQDRTDKLLGLAYYR